MLNGEKENFSLPAGTEPRLHSHGPRVCDVDEEGIVCVPKYVMRKRAFFLSVQNKGLGILKEMGFHDVHTPALFWVRRSP